MKLTQRLSLKLRLTLLFLVLSLTAWFAASVVAWQQTSHKLDKLFDTQQMLFAKRLLTMDLDEIHAPQRMREIPKKPGMAAWTMTLWLLLSTPRRKNAAE
jgi:two-component system sensor histidine kinase QseC